MKRPRRLIILIILLAIAAFFLIDYLFAMRLDKKAIEKRIGLFQQHMDPYLAMPDDRKRTVDELLGFKDNPKELKRICIEAVKEANRKHGIPEDSAEQFTSLGMCAAFAEAMAQYLGNDIPSYSGDAWTMYKRRPRFRRYQLYPESIDLFPFFKGGKGGPQIPVLSGELPPLRTGDIVTLPLPGSRTYVYHAGTIITDTHSRPFKRYVIETRGIIRMNEVDGGNIKLQMGSATEKMVPIVEVLGTISS